MAGISVGGLASGLDVNSLVDQLVAAERQPTAKRLELKEAAYTAQLSTYGTLKGALSTFQTSVRGLSDASKFNARSATVSDKNVLSATASSIADSGSYSVKVDQLAQSHSLASGAYSAVTDEIGTGTLTIRLGTTDYDPNTDTYNGFTAKEDGSTFSLDIDSSNNTLAGIRDAINDAGIDVKASIVNDGSGFRLVLTSNATGAENGIRITVTDDDYDASTNTDGNVDAEGLSQLAFNDTATHMQQTMAAQDALLSVNGLAVSSASNTVTGVVDGVTLNLKSTSDSAVSLNVQRDTAGARKAIDGFVKAYNELNALLDTMGQYDPETKQAGVLQGDALLRGVATQIRRSLLPSGNDGLILADLGITTVATDEVQADGSVLPSGSLTVDSAVLDKFMSERFDDVAKVFAPAATPSHAEVRYLGGAVDAEPGTYGVNITRAASQGSLSGGAIADPAAIVIDGDNDSLTFKIDGTSASITLSQGTYTAAALAAEIQSRINGTEAIKDAGLGVGVEFDGAGFLFTSDSFGSESSVAITAVDARTSATLGLSVAEGTAGVDVAGTIGGVAATGSGRTLTGSGAAGGLQLEITGTTTGARGFVDVTSGMTGSLIKALDSYLASDGLLSDKIGSLNDRMEDLAEQGAALDARMTRAEERYRAQFNALEMLVSQLNTTGDYLAQQLENLPSLNKKR